MKSLPPSKCATVSTYDINAPSTYDILMAPLTLAEAKECRDRYGHLVAIVPLSLEEVMGTKVGFEALACAKVTGTAFKLEDVTCRLVGARGQDLHVEVSGIVE